MSELPPGPKVNPFELIREMVFGAPEVVSNPLNYFRRLHKDYGDLVFTDFGIGRFYFTNNPALIRKIYVSEPRAYAKADAYKEAAHFLGKGILNSEGDFWAQQRGMIQPAFTKSRLHAFVESMSETSDSALTSLGQGADVSTLSMHIALENICKFLFGEDFAANEKVIREAVHFGNDFISRRIQAPVKLPVYLPALKNLRFFYYRFQLDQILYKIIDERLKSAPKPHKDLLGMLLVAEAEHTKNEVQHATDGAARRGHGWPLRGVRKEQIRDEILTLLIAGHETTGFTLAMALWLIAKYPDVQDKLRAELKQNLAGGKVSPEALEKCSYLEAVVSETLRLYPAAWIIGRHIKSDEVFEGRLLKKDSEIQTCIMELHRNAAYWSDPDEFKPQRFLGESAEPTVKQAYMPFGAGPRKCIGNVFALLEMQVAIAKILMSYKLSLADNREPELEFLFTVRLKNPLPVNFTRI